MPRKLCVICQYAIEIMTPPNTLTCSIICEKVRTGEIDGKEWERLGGRGTLPGRYYAD